MDGVGAERAIPATQSAPAMSKDVEATLDYVGDSDVRACYGARPNVTMDGIRAVIRGLTMPGFTIDENLVAYRFNLLHDKLDKRQAYAQTMQAIVDAGGLHDEEEDIARIKTKALVFHGRDDKAVPGTEGFQLLGLLSEAHGFSSRMAAIGR